MQTYLCRVSPAARQILIRLSRDPMMYVERKQEVWNEQSEM